MLLAYNFSDVWSLGFGIALVTGGAIGGFFLARMVRSWARADATVETFTLQDLREMRTRGEISDAEFERMRAAIIGQHARRSGSSAAADRRAGLEPPEDGEPS